MRRLLAVIAWLLLTVALLGGVAAWALSSTWVTVKLARFALHRALPDARVKELSLRNQILSWPGTFRAEDVSCSLEAKGRTYRARAPQLVVTGLESLLEKSSRLNVSLEGAQLNSEPGEAHGVAANLQVDFAARRLNRIDGKVSADAVMWDKFRLERVTFRVAKEDRGYAFDNIVGRCYGGQIQAQAQIVPDGLVYSLTVTADAIDTARLSEWNDQIAAQLAGRAGGTLRLAGRGESLLALETDVVMGAGAKVNAALLSAIAPYIPASPEKKVLAALIAKGQQLPVEVLSFKLKSRTPQHLEGEITLKSRAVNLELNLSNDITTDGTLTSLIDYWNTYLKP